MTGTELDDILASDDTQETTQEQVETTTEGQTRDEQGRFAAKAATETATEQSEVVEAQAEGTEPEHGKVPQQALHAAREKAREKDQENEALKQQLAELRGQVQLLSQRSTQSQPAKEEAKAPDFWEDPNAFVQGALTPVQQQMQQQREQFSKMLAQQAHGKETVDTAYQAFAQAAQANPSTMAGEYQSIMKSDHPYDALVAWHKRQETLRTVGNDPNAWLEAEMEKRLADPAYQAKVLEKIKGAAAANLNRSAPVTSLPPSLNRLPAGGNTAEDNDVSDAALFSHAMR